MKPTGQTKPNSARVSKPLPLAFWLSLIALLLCLTCDAQFRDKKKTKVVDTVSIERLASIHLAAKLEGQYFIEANQENALGCIAQQMFTGKVADTVKCQGAFNLMKIDLQRKVKYSSDWNEYYNFEVQQIVKFINQNRQKIQTRAKAIEKTLTENKALMLLHGM